MGRGGMRVNTSATAGGGGEEGAIDVGGKAEWGEMKMFWRDGFSGETDLNVHHHRSAGIEMNVVVLK